MRSQLERSTTSIVLYLLTLLALNSLQVLAKSRECPRSSALLEFKQYVPECATKLSLGNFTRGSSTHIEAVYASLTHRVARSGAAGYLTCFEGLSFFGQLSTRDLASQAADVGMRFISILQPVEYSSGNQPNSLSPDNLAAAA